MGKALLAQSVSWNAANGSFRAIGGYGGDQSATEATRQAVVRVAGVLSMLGCRLNATGTGRTYRSRINGSNGTQVVNATDTTAGVYQDTTHTDSLSAGDKISVSQASTGTPVAQWFRALFEATGDHACLHLAGTTTFSQSVTTRYFPLGGGGATTSGMVTEASASTKIRTGGTARYLQAYVTQNTGATTHTVRLRINGGNSASSLTVTSGATGLFEDTSNSDTVASGDLLAYSIVAAAGGAGTFDCSFIGSWLINTTDDKNDVIVSNQVSRSASSTASYAILSGYADLSTTEANRTIRHGFDGSATRLRIYLTANTYGGNATLKFRKNAGAGNQVVTITAGATGWLEDTTNTDTFAASDDCCFELDEGTSGSITFTQIVVTEEEQQVVNATVNPGVGSLTLTGLAPTVSAGASVTPSPQALSLTGFAPTVTPINTVEPTPGALTLTGFAPAITADSEVSPAAGALTLTGFAPTVTGTTPIDPLTGALSLTGFAPAVSYGASVTPAAQALTLTGLAPTVTATTPINPLTGTLTLTGFAPAVSATANVSPAKQALTLTGHIPLVAIAVQPGRGSLTLTGFAPTVSYTASWRFIPRISNFEQTQRQINTILAVIYENMPNYGDALPNIAGSVNGRLFYNTDDTTLYQLQDGAWVAI